MNLKRFQFLLSSLRFDDKSTRDARRISEKLAAFKSVWTFFNENCKKSYELSPYTTIDEMLRAFKGRCGFRQYMPSKPAKYGIKIFMICDSESKYMHEGIIYVGKQPNQDVNKKISLDIVLELTKPIVNSGKNITMDNWFTSIPLARELIKRKLTLVGTIKSNKPEIPLNFLPNKNREVKSSVFGFTKDMTLVSFVPKKNKAVILLSTMHNDNQINNETKKPEIIEFYNSTKSGVDTLDQMCVTYTCGRATRRWPMCLFYCMLDIIGVNSYVIYSENTKSKIKRRVFLKELGLSLIEPFMRLRYEKKNVHRPIKILISRFLKINKEIPNNKIKKRSEGRCYECKRVKDKKTTITCKSCEKFCCNEHRNIYCNECDAETVDDYVNT